MKRIQNPILAQLLMEIRFAPSKQHAKQLDSAEKLLSIIDKNRDYPYEFVCFQITGYRPKTGPIDEMISGKQLVEDLPIFIAKLSGKLAPEVSDQNETIYSIQQLAKKINVSTKTINRWRKKGLVGRKYVFEDGVMRFGFTQSGIERFRLAHPRLVAGASKFSRLSKEENERIIALAVKLATDGSMSRRKIINTIARQTQRGAETIRLLLHRFEKDTYGKNVLASGRKFVSPKDAGTIYQLYNSGVKVPALMGKFAVSKNTIYRIINQRRAKNILATRLEFIHNSEFDKQNAEEKILGSQTISRPSGGLLNRQQEIELFRRYNFLKYLAAKLRNKIDATYPRSSIIGRVERYIQQAQKIKDIIIESNLRLVMRVASRHAGIANRQDLVGEGNLSLLRAVEKFDYSRGFRFSTYASWVLAKDFARLAPAEKTRPDRAGAADFSYIGRNLRSEDTGDIEAVERASASLEAAMNNELDEREQYIIRQHFGVPATTIRRKTKTLRQIGDDLGITRERVRQIELEALRKLRQRLSDEEFELLENEL